MNNKNKSAFLMLCLPLSFTACGNSTSSNPDSVNINTALIGTWNYSHHSTGWFDSALIVFKNDGSFTESAVYNLVGSYYQTVISSGRWSATNDSMKITTTIVNSTKDFGATWKSIMNSSSVARNMVYSIVADSLYMITWDADSSKNDSLGFKQIK